MNPEQIPLAENPEQIPLAEMVGEDDYELALTLIRQWDMEKYEKSIKEAEAKIDSLF